MIVLYVLLLAAGVVCFAANALNKEPRRVDLLSLGLFFVFLVPLIQYLTRLANN